MVADFKEQLKSDHVRIDEDGFKKDADFIRAMIRADGNFLAFFERPIAAGLAAAVLLVLLWPVAAWLLRREP